jgi:hypothetical protein
MILVMQTICYMLSFASFFTSIVFDSLREEEAEQTRGADFLAIYMYPADRLLFKT